MITSVVVFCTGRLNMVFLLRNIAKEVHLSMVVEYLTYSFTDDIDLMGETVTEVLQTF